MTDIDKSAATKKRTSGGGNWLFETLTANSFFTPERMTEEHHLIDLTTKEFVDNEVSPNNKHLEQKDWDLARRLLRRCGDLGILGTDVSETYDGVLMDKVSSAIIASRLGQSGSFSTTFGAQTGIAILPIALFGTNEQKQKYLPKLVSGECVGAYCLSESGSGSDALGAKTKATPQSDGTFLLTGEKMWISNGGFADLYVVFAQVDGNKFSAFLVERQWEGVSTGEEEHKMGLKGSSTTPVILQDVRVPKENLLGEIGKGHKVAFNVLNYGRFKLAAAASGSAQLAIGESARYASERKQFGQSISEFGAIKHKLGEMSIYAYALESLVYRTAGLLDEALQESNDHDKGLLAALEEHAIESSILKVAGSEILDFVLDQNIQIHGGNGYVEDYPAERHYRDSRVNRIFEGTNEINRLLIPGMLIRKALNGDLPLVEAAKKIASDLSNPTTVSHEPDSLLSDEAQAVRMFKKASIAVLGLAMRTYGKNLSEEQEVLSFTADMLIDTFTAESVVGRAQQAISNQTASASFQSNAAKAFVSDAAERIGTKARSALAAMIEGEELKTHLAALRKLLKVKPVNTVIIRRKLANESVSRSGYIF
tara:strand:- start:70643 stop:72430 length:1788 start_codon:yes stop_codon:yes gene_type:complete